MKIIAEHLVLDGFAVKKVMEIEIQIGVRSDGIQIGGYEVPYSFFYVNTDKGMVEMSFEHFTKCRMAFDEVLQARARKELGKTKV